MNDAEWEQLLQDFQSDDADRLIHASEILREVTDRSRIPDLLRLLDCDDFLVRESAATPLIAMEGLRVLPALLRALERGEEDGHDNDGLAFEIMELVEMNGADAAPVLLAMLESGGPRDRADAAGLLGLVVGAITFEPLVKASRDPEPRVRREAAGALGSFRGEPEALDAVLALLEDPDEGVRAAAALALRWLGGVQTLAALRRILEDPSGKVRGTAVGSLGSFAGHPDVLDAVLGRLDDPDERVRTSVADALGAIGGPRAVEALRRLRKDPTSPVRTSAVDALKRLNEDPNPSAAAPAESIGQRPQTNAESVIFPVVGLLGGLGSGLAWALIRGMEALAMVDVVVRSGVIGLTLGLGLALARGIGLRNLNSRSGLSFAGLFAGLGASLIWTLTRGVDTTETIGGAVRWGTLGLVLGLGFASLSEAGLRGLATMRGLAWLTLVVAGLLTVWTLLP